MDLAPLACEDETRQGRQMILAELPTLLVYPVSLDTYLKWIKKKKMFWVPVHI